MMPGETLTDSLTQEILVVPYTSRDEDRLNALRSETMSRFTRNEFIDGWFLIRRSGTPGYVPEAIATEFHSIASPDIIWETLSVIRDPLALERLSPLPNLEEQEKIAVDISVANNNWALLGFVALRLLELAVGFVEKYCYSHPQQTGALLEDEIDLRVRPLRAALARAPWPVEIGMWSGVARHLAAIAGRYSAFWEASICQVVADRMAESEEARTSTSWLERIEDDVLVASLTIAAIKVAASSTYQNKLMLVFVQRIIKRLEDHPQHLLIDSISSHHLFGEAVGRAIAIAADENGMPPSWLMNQLRRYDLPWEGWGVDALQLRDACSRTAWLLFTMCVAGRMLQDSGGSSSALHSLVAQRVTRDVEHWEWEFSHRVDSLRLLAREIGRSKIALPQNVDELIERIRQAGNNNSTA